MDNTTCEYCGHHVGDPSLLTAIWADDYDPTALTPSGLYQCFGPGGVVEKMAALGWEVGIDNEDGLEGMEKPYTAEFIQRIEKWATYSATADTITEAVCLAAKAALEGEGR